MNSIDQWFREVVDKLSQPLPLEAHRYRPLSVTQKGAWVAYYIDLRTMIEFAQSVLGSTLSLVAEPVPSPKGFFVKAQVILRHPEGEIVYTDMGYASDDTQGEGYKSATTDAYRRVLSHIGIGRYLYHLPRIFISGEQTTSGFRFTRDPLTVLQDVFERQRSGQVDGVCFYTDQETPTDTPDKEQRRGENANMKSWYGELGVDNEDDAISSFKSIYANATSGYSDKQIRAFMLVTPPNEETTEKLLLGDKLFIKQRLDAKLGNKK